LRVFFSQVAVSRFVAPLFQYQLKSLTSQTFPVCGHSFHRVCLHDYLVEHCFGNFSGSAVRGETAIAGTTCPMPDETSQGVHACVCVCVCGVFCVCVVCVWCVCVCVCVVSVCHFALPRTVFGLDSVRSV
jgi:hypothetical protein